MAALRARMPLARFHPVAQFAAALRALGPANFLYSDGDALFIHGHRRRHLAGAPAVPPGLHLLCRRCAPGQQVVLAASVALTSEPGWQPLAEGELVVAQRGPHRRALRLAFPEGDTPVMGNYWGGWGMGFGWPFMLLFWGLVIGALIALVTWLMRQNSGGAEAAHSTALEILQQRYARGEIGRDEYEQKKRDLS
jgi:putative membrane protein